MIFKDFCIAVGNFTKYKKLLSRRLGDVILYVVCLMLVCSIGVVIIPTVIQTNKIYDGFVEALPQFSITESGLTVSEPFDFEFSGVKIGLSDSVEFEEADFGDNISGFLLDKDTIIIKNFGNVMSFNYSEFNPDGTGYEITNADLQGYKNFLYIFIVIFSILMTVSLAFSYVIDGLLVALIASVFCALMRIHRPIFELVKLAMYSQTLPMLITALVTPFGINMHTTVSTGLAVLILVLAVRHDRNNTPDEGVPIDVM